MEYADGLRPFLSGVWCVVVSLVGLVVFGVGFVVLRVFLVSVCEFRSVFDLPRILGSYGTRSSGCERSYSMSK